MKSIKRWWNRVSGRLLAEGEEPRDVTAMELCRMLQRCPACSNNFEDHAYALFAVTVLGDDRSGRLKEFFNAIEENRWEDARKYQDFDQKRDAVVAYALKCRTGSLVMVMERSPSEIYETDRLIACTLIDEEHGQSLDRIISANEWRSLSGSGTA
ncbi:MAG: hypothetical protein IPM66_09935 [Acidobacteriota bacterium]|nr:MAG: hypothetical protein IPM66_09935 [Acidobacteriota bacterium]